MPGFFQPEPNVTQAYHNNGNNYHNGDISEIVSFTKRILDFLILTVIVF